MYKFNSAGGFPEESTETKIQIMNLAIKMGLTYPEDENVQGLSTYILEMARYDLDTDLRDRSRFMTALMGLAPSSENAAGEAVQVDEDSLAEFAEHSAGIMLPRKPAPVNQSLLEVEGMPSFTVGSLSSFVGHYVSGYECLAPWAVVQPNPATRDATPTDSDSQLFSDKVGSAKKAADKDTRPFYDEESDRSTEDEESVDSDSDSGSESSSGSDTDSDSDDSDSDESSAASESSAVPTSSSEESASDSEEEVRNNSVSIIS
jgi:AP-3 complex subunit beta